MSTLRRTTTYAGHNFFLRLFMPASLLLACRDAETITDPEYRVASQRVVLAVPGFQLASVSAGGNNSCGVDKGGKAYCWGNNALGKLGDGTFDTHTGPVPVAGAQTFVSISAGGDHTCGVTRSGQALCWSYNGFGQSGNGTTTSSILPVPVSGGYSFLSLSASPVASSIGTPGYTCGITRVAALCWGYNNVGQLGNATTVASSVPAPVAGGHTFTSLSAGGQHACGITKSGQALCWGGNLSGQLGNGTTTGSSIPVPVSGGYTFISISAGVTHTCGVTRDGLALCWGDGPLLGIGNFVPPSSVPVATSGGYTFTSVSAGGQHTCGITKGGQVLCWGRNDVGQLGNGFGQAYGLPVPVAGGFRAGSISAGSEHNCGVSSTIGTWCWGRNANGQLGTSELTGLENRYAPTPVGAAQAAKGLSLHSQHGWGDEPTAFNAGGILDDSFRFVYAAFSILELGIAGAGGFSHIFTSASAIENYLPALGTPGALIADQVDASSTASGVFGGDVTALRLNVDFTESFFAGPAPSSIEALTPVATPRTPFGDYTLCNFTSLPQLNGLKVREFLGIVETLLGGGTAIYDITQLRPVTADLNTSFSDGVRSPWAADHIVLGACP